MSQITGPTSGGGGGGGTVTSVTGGSNINITGNPAVNPTVNLDDTVKRISKHHSSDGFNCNSGRNYRNRYQRYKYSWRRYDTNRKMYLHLFLMAMI